MPRKVIPPDLWTMSKRPLRFMVGLHIENLFPVSLRYALPAPLNQGNTSSCSGHAQIEAEYIADVVEGFISQTERLTVNDVTTLGSPLFNYFGARTIEGSTTEDGGANLDDNITAAETLGTPSFELWPTSDDAVLLTPPPEVYSAAKGCLLGGSTRVSHDRYTISALLTNKKPVILGMALFPESMRAGPDGFVPLPADENSLIGYHAMVVVEVKPDARTFGLTCHWFNDDGTPYGDAGILHFPFEYVERYANSTTVLGQIGLVGNNTGAVARPDFEDA